MTQANTARRDGDTFQARMFWHRAADMLRGDSAIARMGFEKGPKGFDDIWLTYKPGLGLQDAFGEPLRQRHIQCKWHVSPGDYGHADLIDPDFINAQSRSLLQRALDAQRRHAPDVTGIRFELLSNWGIAAADVLRPMVHQRNASLRPERVFEGGPASKAGRLRAVWCGHLGIDEPALRQLSRTLGLRHAPQALDQVREDLEAPFRLAGLRPIPAQESVFPYDDVLFQWLAQGRLEFGPQELRERCSAEGLLGPGTPEPRTYGVKSFEHPIYPLEDRCVKVLSLLDRFQERQIRDPTAWYGDLYPALRTFLLDAAREGDRLRLALDAHVTLAFAAGAVLNVKSGCFVELEQRSPDRQVWSATDQEKSDSWPTLEFAEEGQGDDMHVGISLTHDVAPALRAHLADLGPGARLMLAGFAPGASGRSVTCGRHACDLAEAVAAAISPCRTQGRTHLYIAAPNAFSFFLGQRLAQLGSVTLYEHDFEGLHGGGYQPSLSLPATGA